jgi:hypothetical protein
MRFFLAALLLKLFAFVIFSALSNRAGGTKNTVNFFFSYTRDYGSYVIPATTLADSGEYYEPAGDEKLLAFKMPGMTPVFLPLYLLFGFNGGLTALALIQLLVDALCCVLLGRITYSLTGNRLSFFIAFLLYALSSVVSVTSHYADSEFLCTSTAIISLYFAVCSNRKSAWFFSGLFATWSVFFRPTSIIVLIICGTLAILRSQNRRKAALYFIIPFLVCESLWISRNYIRMNRFVPAELSVQTFGSSAMRSVFSVVKALGGDLQSWNPDSEMRWFNEPGTQNYDEAYAESFPFPSYVTKAGITKQEMKLLREKYNSWVTTSSPETKSGLEPEIEKLANDIVLRFRKNSPFHYYVLAPLRIVLTFVAIKRPYGFSFPQNGIAERAVRAWHFVAYYIGVIGFVIAILFRSIRKNKQLMLLWLLPLGHIFLYGFVLRFSENRYLVPMHPFMLIFSAFVISQLHHLFVKRHSETPDFEKSGIPG